MISRKDIVQLDTSKLPYLRNIELTKHSPKDFGLTRWTPGFLIPDFWMRKIYRNEAYHDTDYPTRETERLNAGQKKILHDYVNKRRRQFDFAESFMSKGRRRSDLPPEDNLIDYLERPHERFMKKKRLGISNSHNISAHHGHKFQPENVIVEKALVKMSNLSEEDEIRFKELVNNQEYMNNLRNLVGAYLENDDNSFVDL